MPITPPTKVSLKPKRHHGYSALLFVLGTLFPPLAVAARFGIGADFWLNLLLTICGYIPGHVHNFYIQNIRNNKTNARTPKWAQRYGLVDTTTIKRKEKRSQWASRYNDRLPNSTLENQPYEEGQEAGSSLEVSSEPGDTRRTQGNGELWNPEEESYYNASSSNSNGSGASGGRWRYPANFEETVIENDSGSKRKKKKEKKDRWARTEDAYSISEEQTARKKSKKKKNRAAASAPSFTSRDSVTQFPEDAEGGLYGENGPADTARTGDEVFNHQF